MPPGVEADLEGFHGPDGGLPDQRADHRDRDPEDRPRTRLAGGDGADLGEVGGAGRTRRGYGDPDAERSRAVGDIQKTRDFDPGGGRLKDETVLKRLAGFQRDGLEELRGRP
jgi:hypothetical protein